MTLEDDLLAGFAKALGVPPGDALRNYVRQGRGLPQGSARLLAWDANSIHAFVFDTPNATGIRGASDMLGEIDRGLREGRHLGIAREQILFAGGGSGLAVVAGGEVAACRRKLHALYAEETWSATCTVADVELVGGAESFGARVRAVGRALARERILIGPDAEPAVPFFLARCGVCGRRAAAERKTRIGGERLECRPCFERIERGKKNVRFGHEPTGFEDIADREGEGFYAVVYLDGNGIGKTIASLKDPLAYAAFSHAIDRVLRESFRTLTERYSLAEAAEERERKGRYQLPICGGDDVVAILPGEVAVPFTRDLLALLEEGADADPDLRQRRIGASAGIAIGKVTFPIRHLLAEAEALLKLAKRRSYAEPHPRSTLSFAVVTDGSPRSESVEPERWKREKEKAALLLSGRPYTLPEFRDFSRRFAIVRQAKKVGRTQLYALHSHAVLGPRQLRNHVLYQIGRREEWQALTAELAGLADRKALAGDPDRCAEQFAPEYGGRRVFDVADMIDLMRHWREPEEGVAR